MSKKALLVGINDFAQPSWQLRGCINDTIEMQGLLKTYFGFQDEDIELLLDSDATGQGIRDGLSWLLGDYTGDGSDVRVFHFSSFGSQVDDRAGDRWECRNDVFVPYDHDCWDNPLRDDGLREIFDAIPEDVSFTFIADCGHSGSIQKVLFECDIEFAPRHLLPPPRIADRIAALLKKRDAEADAWVASELAQMLQAVPPDQWAERMQEYAAQLRERFRNDKYKATSEEQYVLLAACQDRQTAADARIEGEWRGAFTWALSKAITDANGDLTYDDLIGRATAYVRNYEQTPQLECPSAMRNLKVFAPLR